MRLHYLLFAVITGTVMLAQTAPPLRMLPVHQDVSGELMTMTLFAPTRGIPSASEVVQKHGPLLDDLGSAGASISAPLSPTFVQNEFIVRPSFAALPGASFEGLGGGTPGYTITSIPPDTTMAVGPNHVVQWVNSHLAIYSKAGTPLLPAPGFVTGNTPLGRLWRTM